MKLYKVVPIVGHFAHEINASLARLEHEHDEIHCVTSYSAFVPAPEAERAVRAWEVVRAMLDDDESPEALREYIRQSAAGGQMPPYGLVILKAVADALAEAEGGGGADGQTETG